MIYEPQILEEFAQRLYKQAGELTAHYVLGGIFGAGFLGGLVGFGLGFVGPALTTGKASAGDPGAAIQMAVVCALILAAVGGISGFYSAKEKTFELRFRAQQTLCQLQIEKNTRRTETGAQRLESVTS
jgi:hypothetical protein